MKKPPKVGVYTSLDVLFDTRLATLQEILPELVDKALSEGYLDRQFDEFPPITKEKFKFLYDHRNEETLLQAFPTLAVSNIREMCLKLVGQKIGSPYSSGAKLFVNIYPYKPSEEYITKLLDTIVKHMGGFVDVEFINKSEAQLTPQFCKAHFEAMFMYDASLWLDTHAKNQNFKTCKIPNIMLYIPCIYFGTKPDEQTLQQYKAINMSPFRKFEIECSPFIAVNVLDTQVFCIDPILFREGLEKQEPEKAS